MDIIEQCLIHWDKWITIPTTTILIDDRSESSVVHLACVTATLLDLSRFGASHSPLKRLSLHSLHFVKSREFDHGDVPLQQPPQPNDLSKNDLPRLVRYPHEVTLGA